jgi:hypothetical protein
MIKITIILMDKRKNKVKLIKISVKKEIVKEDFKKKKYKKYLILI